MKRKKRIEHWRERQLCSQVRDVLNGLFPACGDPVLRDLYVHTLMPAPNSARLHVCCHVLNEDLDKELARTRLANAAGMLRCEVAAAIHRKHAPELVFEVV